MCIILHMKTFISAITVVAAIALAASGIIYLRANVHINTAGQASVISQSVETLGYPKPLYQNLPSMTGGIFIQFSPLGSASTSLYGLDMHSLLMQRSPLQYAYPSVSRDGRWIVGFFYQSRGPLQPNGLYIFDVPNAAVEQFAVLSDDADASFPAMSPDDTQVAYMVTPRVVDPVAATRPETSSIYIVSKSGTPRFVIHGAYPHWSPDGGSLVYLGDDGLHTVALATGVDTSIWRAADGHASTHMQFALSADGKMIALSQAENAPNMFVATITNWSPFTLSSYRIVPGYDYNPVFSPDGSAIAFLQFDLASSTDPTATHRRLMAYDFNSGIEQDIADMSRASGATTVIDSWVYALNK